MKTALHLSSQNAHTQTELISCSLSTLKTNLWLLLREFRCCDPPPFHFKPLNVKPSHAQILIGNQEATGSPFGLHFNRMSSKHLPYSKLADQPTTGNHQKTISIAPWWMAPAHKAEGSSIFPCASSSSGECAPLPPLPAAGRCATWTLVHWWCVCIDNVSRPPASSVCAALNAQRASMKGVNDATASAAR